MSYQVRVRGLTRQPWRLLTSAPNTVSTTPLMIDLDDGDTRRRLQNERARFVVLPDLNFVLRRAGNVALTTTASGMVVRMPRACTVWGVATSVGTAPATTAVTIDVHKIAAGGASTAAGTTIFTTQANRPSIAASGTVSTFPGSSGMGVPEVQAMAAGDLLRVEIDVIGTGTVGADLVVQIFAY